MRKVRRESSIRFFSNCNQKQLWRKLKAVGVITDDNRQCSVDLNEFNDVCTMPNLSPGDSAFNILPTASLGSFSFRNVTENEVFYAMSQIKSEAVGADGIHLKFLKLIFPAISKHFTYLINSIISSSVVPNLWKIAKVIPIPKIKQPKVPSDFRPISILSVCYKIFEVVVREQILFHLKTSNLVSDFQSGFRKGHSTTGILLDITETIRANLDRGNVSALIFLDFRKAFDSINHKILVGKLYTKFNFSHTACKLVWSLLSDRKQFVQVENEISDTINICRGVPQGSIFGPLLFLLYINDIFENVSFLKCYTFADDVQLLATSESSDLVSFQNNINRDLDRVADWSKANDLSLNPLKCKIMIFSKPSNISLNIFLNSNRLEIVTHYKTLGLIIDNDLSFNHHVNFVISRVSWTLRRLYNIGYYLPLDIRRRVALSLCLPLFLYCMEVYSGTSSLNIQRLHLCFNRVIRYIFGLGPYDHVSVYCKDLLGCEFEEYINLRLMIFFYKTVKFGNPPYLLDKFSFGVSSRTHSLNLPRHSSLIMTRSFVIKISRLWNSVIPYQNRKFSYPVSNFKDIYLSNI